jgi:asparagine synthase (glutamine-hydrolysing)
MRKALVNLPNDIKWRRDKQGFITPEELWLKNDLQKTIRGTFEKSILDDYGIIDKNEYLIAYNSFINGNSNLHYNDLTRVYLAELWAKKFIK